MAEAEILQGEVPGLVPGAVHLTGPAVHVCVQRDPPMKPTFQEFIMITQFISYRKKMYSLF